MTSARLDAIDATLAGLQTRLASVELEAATSVEEINTFYLMWAGAPIASLGFRGVRGLTCRRVAQARSSF